MPKPPEQITRPDDGPTIDTSPAAVEQLARDHAASAKNAQGFRQFQHEYTAGVLRALNNEVTLLRAALFQLKELGEQGMKPDPTEWLTFHDKVAQVAREALGHGK